MTKTTQATKCVPVNRKFRKLSCQDRVQALNDAGLLNAEDTATWLAEEQKLPLNVANRMIENVVGVFGLPQGIAINFPLNGKLYAVPLVVEEPSVVAALAYSALLAEKHGGFTASLEATRIKGQIQLIDIQDIDSADTAIKANTAMILKELNHLMPAMLERGGGAMALTTQRFKGPTTGKEMLVVYISIDTCDAMGANLVNSLCEGIAPVLEALSGGQALLKILSNLADESLARAELTLPASALAIGKWSGEAVRDRIVMANELALVDPYRATTHNKGIMNGIDPVAIATGNDWRSIEAAAHAYAAREGQYKALTEWSVNSDGALVGRICLPMKVGTVGGSLQTNPAVALNLNLLGIKHAKDLAALMAAVGLAQNFAALRALATAGIQKGHMTLHARSVALSAKVPEAIFDLVVKTLVSENNIKISRAQALITELSAQAE